jgi:hypothetical protein
MLSRIAKSYDTALTLTEETDVILNIQIFWQD